jgi:hypothetical protein
MNPNSLRIVFGIFLIAHGLMTMSLSTVPVPEPSALHTPYFPSWWRNNVDSTWPASRLGLPDGFVQTTGWILWMAALVLFAVAGAGLLVIPGLSALWQIMAAVAAIMSLILLALYWHPWLIIGVLLNVGILVGVFTGWFTRWFPTQ